MHEKSQVTESKESEVYEPPVLDEVGGFAEETQGGGFQRPEPGGPSYWGA